MATSATGQTGSLSPAEEQGISNPSGMILAAAMVVFVLAVLVLVAILRRHHRRRLQREALLRRLRHTQKDARRREARYRTVEGWLVSKHVLSHDPMCALLTRDGDDHEAPTGNNDTSSTASIDLERQASWEVDSTGIECTICYESLAVGDVVSWSPHVACGHLFHHVCIKEWLLDHTDCPCCREVFLPVDRLEDELSPRAIPELIRAQNQRRALCFYCLEHGAVYLPSQVALEDSHLLERLLSRAASVPDRSELSAMRESLKPSVEELASAYAARAPSQSLSDEESQATCERDCDASCPASALEEGSLRSLSHHSYLEAEFDESGR